MMKETGKAIRRVIDAGKKLLGVFWILMILLASSCSNPFGTENTGPRFTPQIDDLEISRNSVSCGREVTISFDYKDPQNDIYIIHMVFVGESNGGAVWAEIYWDSDFVDLESEEGRALVTYSPSCEDDYPSGLYLLSLTVEDENEHVSNELEGEIRLLQ